MERVIQHDRTALAGKEIDIYIPELKLGIEYHGSVYHATVNNIYEEKPKYYHRNKFLEAKKNGIHLIQIFDVDWERNSDKIKAYLKSLIQPNKKIYARNCEIIQLEKEEAHKFIDKYHLQGRAQMGEIAYGLIHKGELYSVMTFDKLRLARHKEGEYELHRYCLKEGYTVLGGAEKIFKHFIKEHNPTYIRSYSDNDYFQGGIYERLNFKNAGQTTPRYYWFFNGIELKRESCQLSKLKKFHPELLEEAYTVEAPNKEVYVMAGIGACQVWRSGNTKWEWTPAQVAT